jgi:DNA polymerase III alpha subunit (gram-positive type)
MIDRRHTYGIMIDTETVNTHDDNGSLDMSDVLPYDIGFAVIDSYGRVYETHSFVNSDIFYYEKDLMDTAYYSNKIPQYLIDIANGDREVANTYQIRKTLLDKIKQYNCKFICAHNAYFDYTALKNIIRWTTKSKCRCFLPENIEWWDTLKMSRAVLGNMPTYRKFCEDNGYLTKYNKPRFTAEILYRFISKNNDFVESHTGLEDVEIEVQILAYCMRQHKKMNKTLFKERD